MRATIIRLQESYAICMKQDGRIINVKRINIPMEAEEGDILIIEESSTTVEEQKGEEKNIHVDDVIIDIW